MKKMVTNHWTEYYFHSFLMSDCFMVTLLKIFGVIDYKENPNNIGFFFELLIMRGSAQIIVLKTMLMNLIK